MAESAAKKGFDLRAAPRNRAPRVQAKPNRAIELSSSDLEIVDTAPASRLRLVKPPVLRTQLGNAYGAKANTRVTHQSPPKPVRAIQLSSSDLEIVDPTPPSRLRVAQPPPLPHHSIDKGTRTDSALDSVQPQLPATVTRRFGLRARVGVIAMLCVAVTAAALTIARPSDHHAKIQNAFISSSIQKTSLAPVNPVQRPAVAMKSAAQVKPSASPRVVPQKVGAPSSHAAVANAKAKSKGKLAATISTHGKSPAATGTRRRPSTVSFPVDL